MTVDRALTAPARRGQDGFTLVELVVAFSLLALIVAMLGGGLRFGAAAWEGAERRGADLQSQQAFRSVVRRLLGSAVPVQPAEDRPLAFHGRPQRLGFVSAAPTDGLDADRYAYLLRLDPAPSGQRLILLWQPLVPGEEPNLIAERGMRGTTLLEDVAGVAFSYRAGGPGDPVGHWQDAWSDGATFPALVRVSVSPAPGEKAWPDLVVPLRVSVARRRGS